MPRFPKKEAEISALAQEMTTGLTNNVAVYPSPPVAPLDLVALINGYVTAKNDATAAQAVAEAAFTAKDEKLEDLVDAMKSDLRYDENTVDFDDDKLKLIGWAGRKAATPLAVPRQTRLLEAPKQGDGWCFLDWKAPLDGGKPKAYKIQRRLRSGGSWQDIATAIITEATLVEQPQKQELEFRIIAVNKAGEGPQGNTVEVVL